LELVNVRLRDRRCGVKTGCVAGIVGTQRAPRSTRNGVSSPPPAAAAVTVLKSPVSLQTRVGIATGLVVVGDLIGSGEAQERGIVGETPNLAVRLQGVADPNMVVIAEGTRKLLGNLFELQDLGSSRRVTSDTPGPAGRFRNARCCPNATTG
jgi:class 3 adenylate cyclase